MAEQSSLITDLYELTMMQAYSHYGMNESAVFELFVRRLPPSRTFLIAAGLNQAVEYLTAVKFTSDEISWLRSTNRLSESFLNCLETFRFTGDVNGIPE